MNSPLLGALVTKISSMADERLLDAGRTFTFETVMSSRDKVEFLRKAQDMGFRT
jgi:predicted ABC-type ATPase